KIVSFHVQEDLVAKLSKAGENLVVIDFYATWCGPCRMIAPKIEEMSREIANVIFLKVDVDQCEEIAAEYNISCMPTFVLIKKNQKVDSFSGANESKLKEMIQKHRHE
ncbi:unnamed protein product, partial [Darwinula stevensoni]